jgi:outer membrane protein OmpA-like peptidoglycan-associated protein
LAVIADQRARSADSLAMSGVRSALEARESRDRVAIQLQMAKDSRENLAASAGSGVPRVNAEPTAKLVSADRAALAKTDLAAVASINKDQRGLVIILPGIDLFASYRAALLPTAQKRLDQVANALLATKERKLIIEGHMDCRGAPTYNQDLSKQRAEAVRSYIVSKGYPGHLIQAQGLGENRPIADNASAEGLANNQRVEIIVDHKAK